MLECNGADIAGACCTPQLQSRISANQLLGDPFGTAPPLKEPDSEVSVGGAAHAATATATATV